MLSLPVLIPGYASHTWLSADGEIFSLDGREVALRLRDTQALVCHGPAAARRLHVAVDRFVDVLSLFAFVRPARWCVPTPRGLADALGLPAPQDREAAALILLDACQMLIRELAGQRAGTTPGTHTAHVDQRTLDQLWLAQRIGWFFAEPCLQVLGATQGAPTGTASPLSSLSALKVWRHLPKWEETAPPGKPGNAPVHEAEAEAILSTALAENTEDRPEQRAYARGVVAAFAPAKADQAPALVLAEAGTGVGKTLGYLAPAFAWRHKNQGPIWLSTYTRNLQRQLDQELDRMYPNPALKEQKVVIRKGRENYLCLMNMEESVTGIAQTLGHVGGAHIEGRTDRKTEKTAVNHADKTDKDADKDEKNRTKIGTGPHTRAKDTLGLILMARWAAASRAGELVGGDCPGWLRELAGIRLSQNLAVRRGECWHGACPHYGTCFAEKMARKAPHAEVVVANHAFVMTQTLLSGDMEQTPPTHFVFDEGHHLFDAADSAYAVCLSGLETRDLRRWILGAERSSPTPFTGRARGLRKRLEDLANTDVELSDLLHQVERAAQILPARDWRDRLTKQAPKGPVEEFLMTVAAQVYARTNPGEQKAAFSLEAQVHPLAEDVRPAASYLADAIQTLLKPLSNLARLIEQRLEDADSDEADADPTLTFAADQRRRLGGIANSIHQRALKPLEFYISMLNELDSQTSDTPDIPDTRDEFVDWFEVTRADARDVDVAYYRKFIDPTEPFMGLLAAQSQGALITSATLTDQTGVAEVDWDSAESLTGTRHLPEPPTRLSLASPYDYAAQSRVFVVTDLDRAKPGQAANAMAKLFLTAGGGGLGLFTSIQRLRAAYQAIAPKLEAKDIPLLAQHVDAMDVTTLIDIFRSETQTCLLGTDALRDGVDVPGSALRLLVFDRMPWPRPTLAHRARRAHFGPRIYDDRLTRFRLRQAFGRLIRQREDRGAFIMLDSRLPTRLEGAFPDGVAVERLSLRETLAALSEFYGSGSL